MMYGVRHLRLSTNCHSLMAVRSCLLCPRRIAYFTVRCIHLRHIRGDQCIWFCYLTSPHAAVGEVVLYCVETRWYFYMDFLYCIHVQITVICRQLLQIAHTNYNRRVKMITGNNSLLRHKITYLRNKPHIGCISRRTWQLSKS
jgi:hypothetical protein